MDSRHCRTSPSRIGVVVSIVEDEVLKITHEKGVSERVLYLYDMVHLTSFTQKIVIVVLSGMEVEDKDVFSYDDEVNNNRATCT